MPHLSHTFKDTEETMQSNLRHPEERRALQLFEPSRVEAQRVEAFCAETSRLEAQRLVARNPLQLSKVEGLGNEWLEAEGIANDVAVWLRLGVSNTSFRLAIAPPHCR